jgi:serine/threonine protein kinase/TolA-binding protein
VVTRLVEGIEEEDLFAAALALPATERGGYLKRACSDDLDLFDRLTSLITAFGDAANFVSEGVSADGTDQIAQYRLLRELGEGGCGIAYLAEQASPVKRHVAVKVIKPGMDTREVIARFEAERQALALMDHPNVAKVFDAGKTHEGRPYFVMELVRGIGITEYCCQSRLSFAERLALFTQVCQAIQHAHQKGIIHRDIKPSNVLVTMHDGLPLVKVIDFGIAKAMQGRLIDQTLHTKIDQIVGTPAYISPEQTEPAQSAVDTRSDIYSLGVLLYELLTGYTPFDAHELAAASIERLRERLRTEEPPRPSRRLSSADDQFLARVSTGSGTTTTKLVKQIRDDLDWIVMQCLEKEPPRRYQAVNELIADLDRYLRHEPVLARPASFAYRVRKLARRNRVAFAGALAAALFVLFITAFAVTMTLQANRIAVERDHAERERQRAQKISNVVLNVFATVDPFETFGSEVSGSALLEQAARSINRELSDQPLARARLLQAVGRAYARRGEFKPAIGYLRHAEQMLRQLPGAGREVLTSIIDLSHALRVGGDLRSARAVLVDGEKLVERLGLQRSVDYAKLLLSRGRIAMYEGRLPDAHSDFESSLNLYRQVAGNRSLEVAEVLIDYATFYSWTDELTQAEHLAREAVAIFEVAAPRTHPDRIAAEVCLAQVLYYQNQLDEAAAIFVSAVQKQIQVFGGNSGMVAETLDSLATVRYAQGNLAEAEALSREAIAASRLAYGDRNLMTASITTTLARTLSELRKYPEAEATLRKALETFAATVPPDHQYVAAAEHLLGEVLLATNRPSEAEAVLTSSMNRWKRSDASPWRAMRSASALGEALYRQGHTIEGEKYLSDSFRELSADPKAELAAKDKARERAKRYLREPQSPPQSKASPI